MRKILFAAAFAILAYTQAFAIIGVGAHYTTNLGTLKGETEALGITTKPTGIQDINLKRDDASVLQGIGFKAWIDIIPVVDIEATFNMAATRYNAYLELVTDQGTNVNVPIEYKPEAPYNMLFDRASPLFGLFSIDGSITYPITFLPVIRPYAGLGISYMASLPIINKKFAEDMGPALAGTSEEITKAFSDAITKADYKFGIGGHGIVGIRAKLPIIPIAAYANAKYYFGGNLDKKFTQGAVFEVGGGFAL